MVADPVTFPILNVGNQVNHIVDNVGNVIVGGVVNVGNNVIGGVINIGNDLVDSDMTNMVNGLSGIVMFAVIIALITSMLTGLQVFLIGFALNMLL